MAEINNGFGLLSQYGLDLGEDTDVRSQLRQKRIADAASMFTADTSRRPLYDPQNVAPNFSKLGAAIGNAIGEKRQDPNFGMPPEIAARLQTAKEVKEVYKSWESENPDATATDRTDYYQELIAKTAMKNGLSDIGIQALTTLEQTRKARQKQDAELEKLDLGNKFDRKTLDARIGAELFKSRKEGIVTVYPRGSNSPNEGITGYLDEQGNVITRGPDGQEVVLTQDKYTFDRPQWDPAKFQARTGGHGGIKDMTPTERGMVRRSMVTAMNLNDSYSKLLNLAKEAKQVGAGNVQGQFGKYVKFASGAVTFAEQVAGLFSPVEGGASGMEVKGAKKDYEMSSRSGRAEWIKDNKEWLEANMPGLKQKGQYASQYIALVTDLTYAKAMANEGGASRSLSDGDFKNNWRAIGGDLNDPEAMAAILLGDADTQDGRIDNLLSVYPPNIVKGMIAEGGFERYEASRRQLDQFRAKPPEEAPSATPDKDGWITLPGGVRVREKAQ
jgi:hypothetical protein